MADLLEIPVHLKTDRQIIHVDMDAFYAQVVIIPRWQMCH